MIIFANYSTFRALLLAAGAQQEYSTSLSTDDGASSVVSETVHETFFCSLSSPYPSPPPRGATAQSGLRPLHFRVFTITLRHTTLGRTPLDG
jgi:hypothetical protein